MHTFILRFWLEPKENKGGTPEWRGVIEHIITGENQYVKDLDEIAAFIWPYLKSMNPGGSPPAKRRQT